MTLMREGNDMQRTIPSARDVVRIIAVAVMFSSAACVAPSAATGSGGPAGPVASNAPEAPAGSSPEPSDCFGVRVPEAYGAPTSIDRLRELPIHAIVGTFESVGTTRWNTPDGTRPTRDEFQSTSAILYRPITFGLDQVILGVPDIASIILRGGTLGCDSMTFADDHDLAMLTKGSTYVVVSMPVNNSAQKPLGRLLLLSAWPVNSEGMVQTESDGDLSLETVKLALLKGLEKTPPSSPGEPTSTTPG